MKPINSIKYEIAPMLVKSFMIQNKMIRGAKRIKPSLDSIAFSLSPLAYSLTHSELSHLPCLSKMTISSFSGLSQSTAFPMYGLPAVYAPLFLHSFKKILLKNSNEIYIKKNILSSFLHELFHEKYLSLEEKKYYEQILPAESSLKDREAEYHQKPNFKLALELALKHRENNTQPSDSDLLALDWLYLASLARPCLPYFQDLKNIEKFLNSMSSIQINLLFHPNPYRSPASYALIKMIAECPSITELHFGRFFDPHVCINKTFAQYLIDAKFIQKLSMNLMPSAMSQSMTLNHIQDLALGLEHNRSITELNLAYQNIKDAGLIVILSALEKNSFIPLKKINLNYCGLSSLGARKLLEYMKTPNSKLDEIILGHQHAISPDLKIAIEKQSQAVLFKNSLQSHSSASDLLQNGKN